MCDEIEIELNEFIPGLLAKEGVDLDRMSAKKRTQRIDDEKDAWRNVFYKMKEEELDELEWEQTTSTIASLQQATGAGNEAAALVPTSTGWIDMETSLRFPEDFISVIVRLDLSRWEMCALVQNRNSFKLENLQAFRPLLAKAKLRLSSKEEFAATPASEREAEALEQWNNHLQFQHATMLEVLNRAARIICKKLPSP